MSGPPNQKLVMVSALIAVAAFASMTCLSAVAPGRWTWTALAIGLVAVAAVIVVVDRRTRVLERRRRAGHCDCGFDLRAAPPKHVSVHSFGVDDRMSSTKKTIVCPECGREQTRWDERSASVTDGA